jgi:hypothetical protein
LGRVSRTLKPQSRGAVRGRVGQLPTAGASSRARSRCVAATPPCALRSRAAGRCGDGRRRRPSHRLGGRHRLCPSRRFVACGGCARGVAALGGPIRTVHAVVADGDPSVERRPRGRTLDAIQLHARNCTSTRGPRFPHAVLGASRPHPARGARPSRARLAQRRPTGLCGPGDPTAMATSATAPPAER